MVNSQIGYLERSPNFKGKNSKPDASDFAF
jgi:hypothetical protein